MFIVKWQNRMLFTWVTIFMNMGQMAMRPEGDKLGRNLPADNNKEIIKLDDYRKRYALSSR